MKKKKNKKLVYWDAKPDIVTVTSECYTPVTIN